MVGRITNSSKNVVNGFDGWIAEYHTQGMEEVWQIFQDEKFSRSRTEGWNEEGMHILSPGDNLTIYDDEGNELWSGVIVLKQNLIERILNWFKRTQPNTFGDVDPILWVQLFRSQPPLRAKLWKAKYY